MGCILAIVAALAPRLAMFFIWLLTDWFSRAYETWLIPLLGFFFMPYTTLVYLWAMLATGALTAGWVLLLILAVLIDISNWGGGRTVVVRHRRVA